MPYYLGNANMPFYQDSSSSIIQDNNSHLIKNKNNVTKCSKSRNGCKDNPDLLPVHLASFNVREIVKQMLLLEDHLFNPRKRCVECICKHFLTIEGFAEEALSLENDISTLPEMLRMLSYYIRKTMASFLENERTDEHILKLANSVRQVRKYVMNKALKYQ